MKYLNNICIGPGSNYFLAYSLSEEIQKHGTDCIDGNGDNAGGYGDGGGDGCAGRLAWDWDIMIGLTCILQIGMELVICCLWGGLASDRR